jgi:hypothetical protein
MNVKHSTSNQIKQSQEKPLLQAKRDDFYLQVSKVSIKTKILNFRTLHQRIVLNKSNTQLKSTHP